MIKVKIAWLLGCKLYQKSSPQDLKSCAGGLRNKDGLYKSILPSAQCAMVSLQRSVS